MELSLFKMHCSHSITEAVNHRWLYVGEMLRLTPKKQIMVPAFNVSHEAASLFPPPRPPPPTAAVGVSEIETEKASFEVKNVIGGLSRALVAEGSRDEALARVMMSVR